MPSYGPPGFGRVKQARAATTAALPAYTLNATTGVFTASANGALAAQDDVVLAVGDNLLLKDEIGGRQPYNWVVQITDLGSTGAPFKFIRAPGYPVRNGEYVFIGEGTANQTKIFMVKTADPIVVNTTPLTIGPAGGSSSGGAAGGVLSGTYPNPDFNASTVPAGSSLGITDALNTGATVILNYRHLLSAGVAGVGFGIAETYSFPDSLGVVAVQGRQSFSWSTATAAVATTRYDIELRSAGAAAAKAFALFGTAGGALIVGPLAATRTPDAVSGVYLSNAAGLYFRDSLDTTWHSAISLSGSDQLNIGNGSIATVIRGGFEFPGAYITNTMTQDVTGASGALATPLTLRANAGAAGPDTAIGNSYQITNSAGFYEEVGRASFLWTVSTVAAETGAFAVLLRNAGVSAAEKFRVVGDGSVLVGTTHSLGAVGMGLANAAAISSRNALDSAYLTLIKLNASDQVEVGDGSADLLLKGASCTFTTGGGADLVKFLYSTTNNDTMMMLTVRKGGLYSTERVTLVAGASVAASGKNFLSVS